MESIVGLALPPIAYQTYGLWLDISLELKEIVELSHQALDIKKAIHAASHALLQSLPSFILCERKDICCECPNSFETRFRPLRIILFDAHPGGVGILEQVLNLQMLLPIAKSALLLVEECECTDGCSNCILDAHCGEFNEMLCKAGALLILRGVVQSYDEEIPSPAA
ncbi:hypothetical protein IE077_000528 [Cardiosporidium cionae]|uniref:MrfA-like Zn-binding domain-containing protein n=1 Tax=Cardiosporidium cionae TaxID=476202 RepID=A0ABQ7J514_9APIC|nr:hypothetical protein IE077_000528 [Cardiosporidium cionae]|eukprot:KAF8817866.1 hypothetical protein IE077_000528 [Cardiosporidium cionae]